MTVDLAALAKLASEATPGPWIRPWGSLDVHWMGGDVLGSQVNLDLAVAAVNALPALVRVALAARLLTDCWDVEHREIMAFVATDDESRLNRRNSWQGTQDAEAVLRAALADLDR